MTIPKEYHDIFEMLIKATNESRVSWIEKSGSTLAVYLPTIIFEIWGGANDDNRGFVAAGIRQPIKGQALIDNFYVEEGDTDFEKMNFLFMAAQRQVRQVNQKLEELRLLLKSGQKVGAVADEILTIDSAQYGPKGQTLDVADRLRSKIISARIINLPVRNETFSVDSPPGASNVFLNVTYKYCGESRSISVPEGSTLSLPE